MSNRTLTVDGETITLTYTMTITDGQGGSANDTILITITGTNDAPIINDVPDIVFAEAINASADNAGAEVTAGTINLVSENGGVGIANDGLDIDAVVEFLSILNLNS